MTRLLTLLIPVTLAACSGTGTTAASKTEWLTDFEQAKTEAGATGRPILADFTGSDWCSWCVRLHDEVFGTQEFQDWASENVVLLELDFPQNTAQSEELRQQNDGLAREYNVTAYPTIVFLDANGDELGRSGYLRGGPAAWTENADGLLRDR